MDGLLVDTEGTWFDVESEIMAALGGPWGEEHQLALFGGPLSSPWVHVALADRPDVTGGRGGPALLDGMVELRQGSGGLDAGRPMAAT